MPASSARSLSASPKVRPSRIMAKVMTSPETPQPKHLKIPRSGDTLNDGDFSPWNGHRPVKLRPAFLSWINRPM